MSDFGTPGTVAHQAPLSSTLSGSLLKLMSMESCHSTTSSSVTPSPPAFNLSQHQDLFQWVGSSHQAAKVLELQQQSFQWIVRVDFLGLTGLIFLQSQGLSSLPHHHSSKASILQHAAFFMHRLTLTLDGWQAMKRTKRLAAGKVQTAPHIFTDQRAPLRW